MMVLDLPLLSPKDETRGPVRVQLQAQAPLNLRNAGFYPQPNYRAEPRMPKTYTINKDNRYLDPKSSNPTFHYILKDEGLWHMGEDRASTAALLFSIRIVTSKMWMRTFKYQPIPTDEIFVKL